jgi:hypothetical protein
MAKYSRFRGQHYSSSTLLPVYKRQNEMTVAVVAEAFDNKQVIVKDILTYHRVAGESLSLFRWMVL